MRGITAITALTILMIASPGMGERGGTAHKAVTAKSDRHAITFRQNSSAPTPDHHRTRSARSTGGRLTPMDHLILEIYNGSESAQEGRAGRAMVGEGCDPDWSALSPWSPTQRRARLPRYDYPRSAGFVGSQVRIRKTRDSSGFVKVEIRDAFGQPVNWNMEANPWATYGLLAGD